MEKAWPIPSYIELFPQDHIAHRLMTFTGIPEDYKYKNIIKLCAEISIYMLRTRGVPLTPEYFCKALGWIDVASWELVYRDFRAHNLTLAGKSLGAGVPQYSEKFVNKKLEEYFE